MYTTDELKKLRKENNYTIYDMAKLLDISYSHYSLIENMKRNLTYDLAIKIAKVFNKKPDDIFLK